MTIIMISKSNSRFSYFTLQRERTVIQRLCYMFLSIFYAKKEDSWEHIARLLADPCTAGIFCIIAASSSNLYTLSTGSLKVTNSRTISPKISARKILLYQKERTWTTSYCDRQGDGDGRTYCIILIDRDVLVYYQIYFLYRINQLIF